MDPKKIHDIDQETGPLHDFAVKLAAYHRSLIDEGFTRGQAMQIVLGYQSTIILSIPPRSG